MTGPSRRTARGLAADEGARGTDAAERTYVEATCTACPVLPTVRTLAANFPRRIAECAANALAPWPAAAEQRELRSRAAGLRRDAEAVLATVCFRWSNGQMDGQVDRLKLIKRTIYGQASYRLLCRRALTAGIPLASRERTMSNSVGVPNPDRC